jgi:hypothetical protein
LVAVDQRRFEFLVQQTPYFALEVNALDGGTIARGKQPDCCGVRHDKASQATPTAPLTIALAAGNVPPTLPKDSTVVSSTASSIASSRSLHKPEN